MKQLREVNKRKYCSNCREIVEIIFDGKDGYCPFCKERGIKHRVYSIDTRGRY